MEKIELLAPAGNKESAIAAIQNGADALYLSGELFGARAFAANFSLDAIKEMVDYAHAYGVKIYVTVNTLIYEQEFVQVMKYIDELYHANVDACIVQDLGLLYAIRRTYPDFEVHASTQMHIYNHEALAFLHTQGLTRAVLARETSLKQMMSYQDVAIEKEVFVHGALCISFSGQCLFSALQLHRSGNRGMCAQNCRMLYRLYEDRKLVQDYAYLLSPKDNFLLEDIDQLKAANVHSLKIEGRMKSPQYVAYTTMLYRKAIDQKDFKIHPSELQTLKVLFNRRYTKAHFYEKNDVQMMNHARPNHEGVPLGTVVYVRNGRLGIQLDLDVHQHDGIRFLNATNDGFTINRLYINDLLVNKATKGETIELDQGQLRVAVGMKVVKTKDVVVEKEIAKTYDHECRKVPVQARVHAYVGKPLVLEVKDDAGNRVEVKSEILVDQAQKRPVEEADITKRIAKTNDTIFAFSKIIVKKDDAIFLPLQQLNALRRIALDKLYAARLATFTRSTVDFSVSPVVDSFTQAKLEITVLTEAQLLACQNVNATLYTSNRALYEAYNTEMDIYYRQSNTTTQQIDDATMVGDIGGVNKGKVLDESMNISNSETVAYLQSLNNQHMYLSRELSHEQIFALVDKFQNTYGFLPNVGIVVYGKAMLMHIKANVLKTNVKTLQPQKKYELEDLHKHRYFVRVDEDDYVAIYQDEPKDELMDIESYKNIGIEIFRIDFTDENADEVTNVLSKIPNY